MPPPPAPAGFDAFRYAHEHFHQVVWMSQNTNHLFPSGPVEEALELALKEKRYADYPYAPGDPELKELVLRDYPLPGAVVGITGGGTEALYMIARALLSPGDEVIASDPSYLIIHRFIELSGARVVSLDIYQPPYRLTLERVQAALTPRTRMLLLIDPLNPLGSGYSPEEVRGFTDLARDHHLLLLHDTTYRDFAERHTLAGALYPEGTLTVWSVSKNCGLAGVRLGGYLATPELAAKVARYNTNDLGVSVFSQAAAKAALKAKPHVFPAVLKQTRENQQTIRRVVEDLPGVTLPVYPSQGNMFVLDLTGTGVDPEALQAELLLKHQVFLRAGNYLSPKFGSRFIRASFSNLPSDLEAFREAFPKALEALRPKVVVPSA